MGVELAGSPEEVRRAVQAYWRAGLEAPRAVAARAIAKLLDMGERPGRVDVCPACGSPLCLWCAGAGARARGEAGGSRATPRSVTRPSPQ